MEPEQILSNFADLPGDYRVKVHKHTALEAHSNATDVVLVENYTVYELALKALSETLERRNSAENLIFLMEGISHRCSVCDGGDIFYLLDDQHEIVGKVKEKHSKKCPVGAFIKEAYARK